MKKKYTITDKLKKACKIAQTYCGNELVHGMPHINRMLKNFRRLKSNNKLVNKDGKQILDAVEFAIVLHDIGKKAENSEKKHGTIAIEILKENYNNFFFNIPNHEWIEYAINGHTNITEIRKCKALETSQKICLALLLALDNVDAVGKIGVYRDIKNMRDKFKWLPGKNKENESFLERLLINYYRIDGTDDMDGNVSRIKKIKSKINTKILLDLYDRLRIEQRNYIFELIKKKKLKITDSEIEKALKPSENYCK